jgi:hypothetical protein
MVKEISRNGKRLFTCDVCGFGYELKMDAEMCEKWCSETGTCSIEITSRAVYYPDD